MPVLRAPSPDLPPPPPPPRLADRLAQIAKPEEAL